MPVATPPLVVLLLVAWALVLVSPGSEGQTDQCDKDGDGVRAISCGGADCDDNDANRYPGNPEVCDAAGRDEDCNPCTVRAPTDGDRDGDGLVSASCRNSYGGTHHPTCSQAIVFVDQAQRVVRGLDCDDGNRRVIPGAQLCDGATVRLCGNAGLFESKSCSPGFSCVAQPNGSGMCQMQAKPCTFGGGSVRASGTQTCGQTVNTTSTARDVFLCENGSFTKAQCPSGQVCVPQPNGTGACFPALTK